MKRIAIDMDGVIADTFTTFKMWHLKETGEPFDEAAAEGIKESDAFPNVYRWVNTEGFFRHIPVMPDSQEVVQKLMARYEVFIVSAATEFPPSLRDKQAWLGEHFPFISWRNIVFCGSKSIIKADIMIDDHFKNLDVFDGETFLFTALHNQTLNAGKHQRVNTWREIENKIMGGR